MAKLTDKEIQEFLDDLNKSPGGVKSTEPAFERYRKHFLRNVDFDEIKKYSPEQLIRGARTSEELILIGEHLHKEWGGNHWWWQEYHERRVHLSHLPSLYDVTTDTATGKQRGMWGVPVNPEVYVKSSQSGAQKFAVNRRLFSRFGSWEQITGQQDLFSLVDTPNGPVLRDWKPIPAPKLPSNRPINALIFDIESTGLIGKENSSIISLGLFDTKTKSFGGSAYASFDRNIKYDDVIEKTIIPQWQKSISKPGVQLVSEKQLVEGFIEKIEKTSKTHALMGYNIKQFDLGKVYESAKKYGLQSRFKSAIQQSTIIDVADYAKSFVSQQLGGQIVGWESSQLGINPLGWQLEAIAESLGIAAKEAHAAEADVDMTRAIWEKLRDPSKWDEVARKDFKANVLINAVARNQGRTPLRVSKGINRVNFARQMMGAEAKYIRPLAEHLAEEFPSVTQGATSKATAKIAKGTKRFGIGNIASYGASFVGLNMMMPGSFWQNAFTSVTWEAARVGAQKAGVKGWKTWAAAAGGSLIGNAIWLSAGSLIDGPSDVAVGNTKFSGKKRPQDLISRDNDTGGLPTSLMGIPISPEILSFRRDVIEDKGELAELEADIKRKQAAAQAQLGDFAPSELSAISAPVEGLAGNKNLKEVNLSDYKLTVEDADTLILSKKGLAGLLSKDILVRLSGVDAPEVAGHADDPMEDVRIWQEQAGGKWATEQYKKLVEEQSDLRLVIDTKNKTYGRSLGVLVGDEGQNLALESVRRGLVAALPFGKSSEDVVSRKAIAQAEAEAKASEAGIWQFARYKAIAEASEEIGRPITFNVLTEKTKLGRNLNLGAYASFLQSLGEQQRELTPQEVQTARRVGRTLRKTHGSARFSQKFSGKDDAHNTIEGLRHDGMASGVRKRLTEFGSGYRGVSLVHVTRGTDTKDIESEGLRTSEYERGLAGPSIYATTSQWFSNATAKQKSDLGIPYGTAFKFKADPTKVYAGWSEGGFLGLFKDYKQEKLSEFLKRQNRPDTFEVTVPYNISASKLTNIGERTSSGFVPSNKKAHSKLVSNRPLQESREESLSIVNAAKFAASSTMIFAGLTAVKTPFKDRMSQLVGSKAAPVITRIPAAIWLGEEAVSLAKDPSVENFTRFGLGFAGWELGLRGGRKLADKFIKGRHKGIPGVIGHVAAPIVSSVFSRISGKDDAYNTIEGLRHDGGLSEQIRRENTAFGSGFDAVRSYLQFESINEGKRRFLSTKEKRYTVDKASKFSDRGTVYNTLEGLSQKGLVGDVRTAFSGRDDEYNTIEGLRHDGGLSQKLRVLLTDFGSGWDPIRALAKKLFKESKDPMSELRKSPKFKEALSSAVEKNVLGEGWFGKATLMESTFMGEKFQFVRKTGEIGKQEVAAMKAAEHTVAPSVYSSAEGVVEMELFKGSPLQSLAPEKARELEPQVVEAFKKLHGAGYEHADPHLGNIFLAQTDQGEKIGLIDLGNAKLLSEYNDKQAALRAAQGDIDISSKFIRSLGEESQFAAVDPFAAAENISAGNVLSQLENAPAQSYVDPFAKAASQGDIRQNASRIFESSVKSDQMLSKQLKLEISRTSSVPKKLGSRASIGEEVPKGISSRTISQPMTISSSGPGMGRTEEVAREVTSDAQLSLNFNTPSLGVAQPPRLGPKPNVSQSVVGSQSSTNLPKPDFGPGGDPYRVKRMQRFRKVSRDAVGIGHRSAHNAGRGHSSFKTVV